jgi:undecaprenyl-diphosphatase
LQTLHAIFLALLQGLTEFLPISSSGHLILVPAFLGWEDQGLAFDVAVHLGTLIAVVAYFRRELAAMTVGWLRSCRGQSSADGRLAWMVIIGSLPLVAVGLLLASWIEGNLRSPLVVAAATGGFGVVLWVADRLSSHGRDEHSVSVADALLVGSAQTLALIPGTSRSGITITAALALGMSREAAARFSFLLSVPAVLMASGWKSLQLFGSAVAVDWAALALGAAAAGVFAYLAIDWFLKFVARSGMLVFAIYRVILAGIIVYVFW